MCKEGVQPDDITSISLLSACSHAGLLDEGMRCYASMVTDCMISAKLEITPYGRRSWSCWPSTGGREYGHGDALYTGCGYMDGFAWCLQNSW
jgi:pentatricopeptide repeat protein